jgi:8-oxo-dGTP pyrophosphatase MutT (NUDIX family)
MAPRQSQLRGSKRRGATGVFNSTAGVAAVRETKEETGIALDPATLRLTLSIHQRNPASTHTRIGFAFEPDHWDGEPVIGEPARCSQLLWVLRGSPDVVLCCAA